MSNSANTSLPAIQNFPRKPGPSSHPHFTNLLLQNRYRVPGVWHRLTSTFQLSKPSIGSLDSWNPYDSKKWMIRSQVSLACIICGSLDTDEWRWPRRRGHLSRYMKYLRTVNGQNVKPNEKSFGNMQFHSRWFCGQLDAQNGKSLSMHADDFIFTAYATIVWLVSSMLVEILSETHPASTWGPVSIEATFLKRRPLPT